MCLTALRYWAVCLYRKLSVTSVSFDDFTVRRSSIGRKIQYSAINLRHVLLIAALFFTSALAYAQTTVVFSDTACVVVTGGTAVNSIQNPPTPATDVKLVFWITGDIASNTEYYDIYSENGSFIGTLNPAFGDCQPYDSVSITVPIDSFIKWSQDGVVNITIDASPAVNTGCGLGNCVYIEAQYISSVASNDAAAFSINSGEEFVCSGTIPITADVANLGTNQITTLSVNWSVNGVLQTAASITGTLDTVNGAGSYTQTVNLGTFPFVAGNSYTIKVWTSLPNGMADTVNANDTATKTVRSGLSGMFTIGGASPDYASFTAAVNDLKAKGICDSVIFKVRSNTYIEQIRIGKIAGANMNAWVIFQSETGDSSDVILTHNANSSMNYTLKLDSTSFITFRRMTIKSDNNSYGRVVEVAGPARYVQFHNNHFIGRPTTTSSLRTVVYYGTSNNYPENHSYKYNRFENGSWGLHYYSTDASDGFVAMNNRFINQYYVGLETTRGDNVVIEDNMVWTNSPYGTFYGILVQNGLTTGRVVGNQVIGPIGGYGIYLASQVADMGTPGLVANNFVSMGNSNSNCFGFYITSCTYYNIYHNSVNVYSNTSNNSYGLYITGGSQNRIFNNNLSSGAGRAMYVGSSFNVSGSDFNNLYNTQSPLAYWQGNVNSLSELQANSGKDSNSFNLPPFYVTDTSYQTAQISLNNNATPLAEVTDDIEDEARSATTPDIGADEFSPPATDAGVVRFIYPTRPFAPGSYTVKAVVKNYGSAPLTAVDINWELSGVAQTVVNWTGSIASGDTGHVVLSSVNFMALTNYSLKAYTTSPNGSADAFAPNDTAQKMNIRPALGGSYTLGGASPDFASFGMMAEWLNQAGVYDSVEVNVRVGTYTEQIMLTSILGADSVKTICIQSESGDSSDTKMSFTPGSLNNYVLRLNGTNWLRVKNLGLEVPTAFYQHLIYLDSNASNNRFESLYLVGNNSSTSSSTSRAQVYITSGLEHDDNLFWNCNFNEGAYGFHWVNFSSNTDNLQILNCRFMNHNYRPVYIRGVNDLKFNENYIANDQAPVTTSYLSVYLVSIDNGEMLKNQVFTGVQTYGAQFSDVDGAGGQRFLVANNFFQSAGSGSTAYYTLLITGCNSIDIVYNSFSSYCNDPGSQVIDYRSNSDVFFQNNIFQHNNGGYAFNTSSTFNPSLSSDYNNLYTTGTNIGNWGTTDVTDLATWISTTTLDSNSISVDAQFEDTTDLHVNASNLNAAGMPFAGVSVDIDMEARDPATPDIGADEFGLAADDAGVVSIDGPAIPFAPGNQSVSVSVLNNGAATLNSVTINWEVNGVLQTPFNWTGTLASGATATGVAVGNFTFLADSSYCIKAWTSLPNGNADAQAINDTTEQCGLYPALSGVYTIGGMNPDFPDFTSAVNALNWGGVTGWVNFMVRDSTYNEAIAIKEVPGASAMDSVAFMGANDTASMVELTNVNNFTMNYVVALFGAEYISFKDIDLSSNPPNFSSYQTVVRIDSSANYNRFYRCKIGTQTTYNTTSTLASLVFYNYNSGFKNQHNRFMYCDFNRGSYGIYLRGENFNDWDTGTVIMNNNFTDQQYRAMYALYQSHLVFSMNTIMSESYTTSYVGTYVDNSRAITFDGNRYMYMNYRAAYFYDADGYSAMMPSVISNNFVHVEGTGSNGYGLYLGYNDNLLLAHNSVNVTNTHTSTTAAYFIYNVSVTSYNNSFQNIGGGPAMRRTSSANLIGSDHNNFYVTGTNLVNDWNTSYIDLASYVAGSGLDSNSISVDPQYTDTTDLHAASIALDGAGMPVSLVTMDIDKEPRNPLTPDIGADEFSTNSDDAAIVAIQYPAVPFPLGINQVKVALLNNGADTLKSVDIYFAVNGAGAVLFSWTGALAPGATLDSVMLGSANFILDTTYRIKAWTSLPNGNTDILPGNDTAEVTGLCPGLSGTYTIGGVNPDFPDFTSAAAALNCGGVVGPVKFLVRNGTYNEQVEIGNVPGTSPTDTICFMAESGDSATVVLTFSANSTDRHTLLLNGTKYISFKGIGFEGSHGSWGDVVILVNGTMNTAFHNCWFNRGTRSTGMGVYLNNADPKNGNTRIDKCQFTGGTYGLYEQGTSTQGDGIWVTNNRFLNQHTYPILITDYNSPYVYRNHIVTTIGRLGSGYIGIYMLACTDSMVVDKNYIYAPTWAEGIRVTSFSSTMTRGRVSNNFISVGDSGNVGSQGLYITSSSNLDIYYNSVRQGSSNTSSDAGFFSGNSNLNIKNNIFANMGAGYAIWSSGSNSGVVSDYNDIYSVGAMYTYYQGVNYANLAAWQTVTGWDANSVSADPDFVSTTDLHMRQPLLDSAAMVIASVLMDYDCQIRDTAKPDIGADEVLFFPDDLKMQAIVNPADECGLDDSTMITVEVFNAGNDDQSGFDISIVIDGDTTTENVGGLNFPSRQSTLYTFTSKFDLSVFKAYVVKTWTNLVDDIYRDNDTLETTINNFPPPVTGITKDTAVCKGTIVNLMASGGVSYLWSNSLTGASIFVAPTFTTTYWVQVTDANGCVAFDSVTVFVSDSTDQVFLTAYTCDTALVGVETVTLTNQGGCDSIVTTTYIYVPPTHDTLAPVIICGNDSAQIFGVYRSMAGFYYDTLANVDGCDSILVQELRIDSAYKYVLTDIAICDGDSVQIFGNWESTAGLYSQTLMAANGCDSIVCQTLIVNPIYATADTNEICEGDSIYLAGAWRSMSGVYTETLSTADGCDSIIDHHLNVIPVQSTGLTAEICEGDSIWLGGAYQTMSGVYVDTLLSSRLCDSIITTTLTVNPNYLENDTISILQGDSVLVHGNWLSMSGDYVDTLTSQDGCDSVVVTTLILTSPARSLSFSSNTNFTSSLIYPLQGTPYNTFNFEVVYTDSSGALPPFGFPRVILDYEGNGVYTNPNDRFVLLQEADVNDMDASDGKLYVGSINALPLGKNWQVLAQVIVGADNIVLGPFNNPDILVEPDLQIFANDITFSNNNPAVSSPLTISAKVTNVSDLAAQNFVVHLKNQNDTSAVYPDITIPTLGANSSTTVQWNITTPPDPSWNPMQVFVDYTDVIVETNELDNNAVRPFINGNYNVQGSIVVAAVVTPGFQCAEPGKLVKVSGFAYYTNTAVQLSDSSVAGAEVNFGTNGAQYSTTTNSNGYFSLSVPAPLVQNSYVVNGTVTDFTLTGNFTTSFSIQDCPCTLPDLTTAASPRSITIFQGDSISGLFRVRNIGCIAAPMNLLSMSQNGGSPTVPNTNIPMLAVGDTFNYNINDIVFNTPGVYSICALADGGFSIQELNESNNSACIVVRVLAPTIDLYPNGGPTGSSYVCGNQPNPTISVRNGGTIASGPFVTKVRVYDHGVLVDSVYHSFAGLAANTSASFSFPFVYGDTGNYAFEVFVDTNIATGGQVAEFSELNNYGWFNRSLIPCKPDLVISGCRNLQVAPVDPAHPGAVTYEATVRNVGNDTAKAPIDVDFIVMPGLTHSTQILTDLAPGQSSLASVTVASVAPATAALKAFADPADLIDEFSEANNSQMDSLCWEFEAVAPCGGGFWNQRYKINTLINVSVALKTLHLYEASSVDIKYEVSGPGIVGTMDLGTFSVQDVKKDCGCPRVTSLPNGFIFAQPGIYTFTFTVDPNNVYTECNEANNVLMVNVEAFDAPDMRVLSQFINPSKLNPDVGESITIDVTYENIGVSNVNSQMELKVLIDDIPFDSIKPVPGLVTGDNTTFSIPSSWFSNIPGAHIIRAIIDSDDELNEANELNNEATRAVVVGEAANLFFAYFQADDSSPAIGDTIDIDFMVGNNGDVDAMADVRISYVNDFLDTISIGTIPISVLKHDSTSWLSMPWIVTDNNTTIVGEIINTNTLEWTYDDNTAYDSLGAFGVIITSAPSCFSSPNGWLKASPQGGLAPYNFAWSNGATGDSISGGPGNYFVDIVDADGVSVRAFGTIDTIPGSLNELPMAMICQGDSINIFGVWRTQPGIFYDTLSTAQGCDSILKQQLNVKPSYQTMEILYECGGLPNQMGIRIDSLLANNGCDSIHISYILYLPGSAGQANLEICQGDSVMIGGVYENTTGVYYDTLQAANGCDSVLTVNLNVVNPFFVQLPTQSICDGDSIMIFGAWRSIAGTYYDSLSGRAGCDSVLAVDLMVNPVYAAMDYAFICQGDSVYAGGGWQTMQGIYFDTLQTMSGCDSIIVTDLNVGTGIVYTVNDSICQGDSIWAGGAWQNMSGMYYDTMSTASGCDSIRITNLTVLPSIMSTVPVSICSGDSIYVGGAWQSMSGIYYDTVIVAGGCDSIIVTDITVIPPVMTSNSRSICEGDSIWLGGAWQSTAGYYQDIFTSLLGCDSIHITQLMITPTITANDTAYVCPGDSALIGGIWQHVPGDYNNVYQAANGCDSVVTTSLIYKTSGCNVDCNGDIGGSAYLDSCGVCVGGNTGKQPCSQGCVSLEVVSFTLVDASTGMDMRTLYDGDTIDKRQIPSFSIRANTCDDSVAPGQIECITFDNGGLTAGNIPGSVVTTLGTGPIGVYGYNPGFPGSNAAMIFNSNAPTGGDFDLGTPHTDFGGPGVGAGGAAGSTYQNNLALNNLLVVSEDLDTTDPNDLRGMGILEFDFSAVGPVIVHSLTIVDIEGKEGPPMVRFYDASGINFNTISLNTVGNNGVANINFGPVAGVSMMTVHFGGSGAIDNVCIETPQTNGSGGVQLPGLSVESVDFDVNGTLFRRENLAPFTIMGDNGSKYFPWNPATGFYQIEGRPYSKRYGKGVVGVSEIINIVVIDGNLIPDCNGDLGGTAYLDSCGVCVGGNTGLNPCASGCQSLEVTSFKLISAVDGSLIGQLSSGDTINRSTIGPFGIRAETCNGLSVGSVLFDLNGSMIQMENQLPYDINGGSVTKPNAWIPPLGTHTLIATPYSQGYGKGTPGIAETVVFTVVDLAPRVISGSDGTADNDLEGEDGNARQDQNSLAEIEATDLVSVKVYPNPTHGRVFIDVYNLDSGDEELVLIDNTGKVLRVMDDPALMSPEMIRFELDIAELPDGIYMVRLTSGERVFNHRLIKQ